MKRALSYASTLFCGNGAKRAFAAATSIASETCAFANDGPYGVAPMTASVPIPGSTLSPLPVRVTIPQGPVQPSPILYLFNGFRVSLSPAGLATFAQPRDASIPIHPRPVDRPDRIFSHECSPPHPHPTSQTCTLR